MKSVYLFGMGGGVGVAAAILPGTGGGRGFSKGVSAAGVLGGSGGGGCGAEMCGLLMSSFGGLSGTAGCVGRVGSMTDHSRGWGLL